jgi:hypothetical protein
MDPAANIKIEIDELARANALSDVAKLELLGDDQLERILPVIAQNILQSGAAHELKDGVDDLINRTRDSVLDTTYLPLVFVQLDGSSTTRMNDDVSDAETREELIDLADEYHDDNVVENMEDILDIMDRMEPFESMSDVDRQWVITNGLVRRELENYGVGVSKYTQAFIDLKQPTGRDLVSFDAKSVRMIRTHERKSEDTPVITGAECAAYVDWHDTLEQDAEMTEEEDEEENKTPTNVVSQRLERLLSNHFDLSSTRCRVPSGGFALRATDGTDEVVSTIDSGEYVLEDLVVAVGRAYIDLLESNDVTLAARRFVGY